MKILIRKWGNSLAIRIPKSLADEMSLREGSQVDLSLEGDKIVIRSGENRYNLQELVSRITKKNRQKEVNLGGPVGNEEW